jgi:hypothetical protein
MYGRNFRLNFAPEQARLRIVYKNPQAAMGISHVGLGVSAFNIAKTLRGQGIDTDVWTAMNDEEFSSRLDAEMASGNAPTHVVISAFYITSSTLRNASVKYPNLNLGVNCHSNVGFLSVEPNGNKLMRECIQLQSASWNFRLSGNTQRFSKWVHDTYSANCAYLPNLYWLEGPPPPKRAWTEGTLRMGGFGAMRPLKNFISAAAAALEIASASRANVEFYVNSGRTEGGDTVFRSMDAMFSGVPFAKLIMIPWQTWPDFRETVRQMHLLIQPSFTESFSMVVADAVSAGVPSVVSSAIEWVPQYWKAESDDVFSIARTGRHLLNDPQSPADGWNALEQNNARGIQAWKDYLTGAQ